MESLALPGPKFVELMEKHGIQPSDLGITPRYKNMLKTGKRKPSKKLVEKLLSLIEQNQGLVLFNRTNPVELVLLNRTNSTKPGLAPQVFNVGGRREYGPIPAWGGCEASRTPRPTSTWLA